MNFGSYLSKEKNTIQKRIDKSLSVWQKKLLDQTSALQHLTHVLRESNRGGKHIRGTLVCLGYDLFGSSRLADIYTIAAAYEILHTSLLIHDDVMDKSLTRRGKKTLYQQLGGDHYGISQAISLGDVGFFLAAQMIQDTKFDSKILSSVVSRFSQIVLDTITGQMLDMKASQKNENVTSHDVITIARLKTARYSLAGPLVIGAMLAGATKKQMQYLFDFGEHLGIAYQLRDDILGVFGDEEVIGKSSTSDITEGKQTLLFLYAKENITKKQKEMLDTYYGKGTIAARDYEAIKQIFLETGALTKVENIIERYINESRLLVSKITKEKANRDLLADFISYLLERKK